MTNPQDGPTASGAPRPRSGQANRAVPYERPLARCARTLLGAQASFLAAVGVAGLISSWGAGLLAPTATTVLGLRSNPAHSGLLLLTAAAAAWAASARHQRTARWIAGLQAGVYAVVFVFGAAFSTGGRGPTALDLNTADDILHAGLALLGFTAAYVFAAHILEPGPTSPPPGSPPDTATARTDAPCRAGSAPGDTRTSAVPDPLGDQR